VLARGEAGAATLSPKEELGKCARWRSNGVAGGVLLARNGGKWELDNEEEEKFVWPALV
jgi:hypothetical protein